MSSGSDTANVLTVATIGIAATSPEILTDAQTLIFAFCFGAIGGVIAALRSTEVMTKKQLSSRILASACLCPGIVAAVLIYGEHELRLLTVGGLCGIGGVLSWYLADYVPEIIPRLVKKLSKKFLSGADDASSN